MGLLNLLYILVQAHEQKHVRYWAQDYFGPFQLAFNLKIEGSG
jgi:hypothetical protein